MPVTLKIAGLLLAAAMLSATADAQVAGVAYAKDKRKGKLSVRVELGVPAARPHHGYAAPPLPPRWVPGHYQSVTRKVWVPGATRREWRPPVHEIRFDPCGRKVRVLVRPGHWVHVAQPGHHELRVEQVWVPGRWVVPGPHCAGGA